MGCGPGGVVGVQPCRIGSVETGVLGELAAQVFGIFAASGGGYGWREGWGSAGAAGGFRLSQVGDGPGAGVRDLSLAGSVRRRAGDRMA
jgi:hypothetical protein